ncbi:hypothetical protein ACL7TT_19525 [Microbulbifer sp. 2304DJ12-6]|uniref:hypothetical protein n=1 Tax=Microbulbifer sp. 2304DJ12-6 TaxID=3233340 RepID=UPI0039AEDCA1
MAHVAKQLLDAVTAAVTGLPITGDRVQQSRTSPPAGSTISPTAPVRNCRTAGIAPKAPP